MRRLEEAFAWLAICGAVLGGLGLIFLSIFDTKRHHKAHRVFLVRVSIWCEIPDDADMYAQLVFVLGVALSAIFTVFEVLSFICGIMTVS